MIEETPPIIETLVQDWTLLSESWRVALVVFALVFGTALVAYLASFIVGAMERRFQKTNNLWDDPVHAAAKAELSMRLNHLLADLMDESPRAQRRA